MADLSAEKFVDDAIPGTGCSGIKSLDFPAVDRVDCINLVRAAMRHALDAAINTFDAGSKRVYSDNEVIGILQKLKETTK